MTDTKNQNEELEDWQGSRWQFTRNRSTWHFDTTRPPSVGEDSYVRVGRFDVDFGDLVDNCISRAVPTSWGRRVRFLSTYKGTSKGNRMYSADAEENDLLRAGANPHHEIFNRAHVVGIPLFNRMYETVGLTNTDGVLFHNQTCGQVFHLHIDNFAGLGPRENSFKRIDMDRDPKIARRFLVMLDDWKYGQVYMFGNTVWHQWRRGDCITWDWINMPYFGVNAGWDNLPVLQLTGYVTKRTHEIMQTASADRIIELI